jgi:FlaA1/EpsC-like NDP-sugar epimerase
LLVIIDAFAAAFAFGLAFMYREGASVFAAADRWKWSNEFAPYGALLVFVIVIRVLSLRSVDLYRIRGEFSFVDDGLRVFKATAIGSLLIVAVAFLYRGGFEFRSFSYARSVLFLTLLSHC